MKKKNLTEQEKLSIKQEAEEIIDSGEKPSFEKIMKMLMRSGKSYVQAMQTTKRLKKAMDEAREKAESEGKPFSEAAFLKNQMNIAPTKVKSTDFRR